MCQQLAAKGEQVHGMIMMVLCVVSGACAYICTYTCSMRVTLVILYNRSSFVCAFISLRILNLKFENVSTMAMSRAE